ncbi:MAG: sugar ABC transporter substrate-binding protein [Anaerolineae bacterium]|nr:sugar ABC transporter substrate-binding protein [Anaerolineae bacterium]
MVTRVLTRRRFLAFSTSGIAAALLTACAATPAPAPAEATGVAAGETVAPAPPAGEVVELRFEDEAEVGPEGFKVFTDVLIPQFEEANPGIKVTFEPAIGDWSQKITAQMAAGDAPDVMVAYGNAAREWMEAEQLLPLEEEFTSDELSDFYEGQLVAFNVNNHLYEIPKYVSTVALSYNKDLMDEAGLDYPTDDWTWDDFLMAADKLTVRDDSGKASQWGYRVAQNYIAHWVWQNGGEWMDKDAMGTKILIDQPKAVEALKFNWDILYTYKYSPSAQEAEGVGSWDFFQTGKLGLHEAHSWQVTDFIARNNFAYDYSLLPHKELSVGHIFADGYGVYAGTKHKAESIKLLRFMTSPEAEREMCTSVLGLQPSRKSVAPVWDTESQGAKAGLNVKAFSDMAAIARLDPYFKNHAKVREIFVPIWDSIWVTGTMGLEEGLTELCTKINEYLATVT